MAACEYTHAGYSARDELITAHYRQLTVQELSVMIRHGLKPIIFVLNNSGYTIERFLHGKTRKYNDISNWCVSSGMSLIVDRC